MNTAIARRTVTYIDEAQRSHSVTIEFFAPEEREPDYWICRSHISAPFDLDSEAAGVDAVQALHLAMVKAGVDLTHPPEHLTGRLQYDGPGENFGFPLPDELQPEDDQEAA